jgi:peptidoglycan/xylan/chitin deacetylase (PgdA/CDA1 family)
MIAEGHQVGHHTWDHKDLTTLTSTEVLAEMNQLSEAFTAIIGGVPKYMRPPFFAYNDAVVAQIAALGFYIVTGDIDTLDWQYGPEGEITTSEGLYVTEQQAGGTLSLEHDVYPTTAETLGMFSRKL